MSKRPRNSDKGNLLMLAAHSPKAMSAAFPALSERSEAELHSNLRALLLLRPILYLEDVPHGRKGEAAAQISELLGCSRSALYKWRRKFRQYGLPGLIRRQRSDRGQSRVLGADLLKAIQEQSPSFRQYGAIARAWRVFGRPASYESFRTWCRKEASLAS